MEIKIEERLKQLKQALADFKNQIDGLPAVNAQPETGTVQAAVNLTVILDNLSKQDVTSIVKNSKNLTNGLISAIELLAIPPEGNMVTNETTFQIAQACSQFFAQAALSLTGIFSSLHWTVQAAAKVFSKKAPEKMNNIAPAAEVIEKVFEIAASRYRLEQLATLNLEELSDVAKQKEIRQKLLSILPANQQAGFPEKLDEAFVTEYQQRCKAYLEQIKLIKVSELKQMSKINAKFELDRKEFEEKFSTFFEKTLPNLITKPAQKQSAGEVAVPLSSILKEEITLPLETLGESVTEEEVITNKETKNAALEENDSMEPTKNSTEKLTLEDEKFPVSIDEFDQFIERQQNKIETLAKQLDGLSNELTGFNTQLKNLETQKQTLSEQVAHIEKSLSQEETTLAKNQEHDKTLTTQLASIAELRKDIAANELVLDSIDKEKLTWLGINEQALESYLEGQKQETDILEKVSSTLSSFFGSFLSEEVKPTVNYEEVKAKLLNNLDEKYKDCLTEQEKLKSQNEASIQQISEHKTQRDELNSNLTVLEKEIEDLQQKITDTNKEQTLIKQKKKQAKEQKSELEAMKEALVKQVELAEQEKRAEEERKRLEETNQTKPPARESIIGEIDPAINLDSTSEKIALKIIKLTEIKKTYNALKLQYASQKGFDRASTLLALAKAWLKLQVAKRNLNKLTKPQHTQEEEIKLEKQSFSSVPPQYRFFSASENPSQEQNSLLSPDPNLNTADTKTQLKS